MKIYTGNGDRGFTSLFGGSKVSKADPRLEAYGLCDELNSVLGWALVELNKTPATKELSQFIHGIQSLLFVLGSRLATDNADMRKKLGNVETSDIKAMEELIDQMSEKLPELKNFILPGGSEAAARLHMARTQSRRLERAVLHFYENSDESDSNIMIYLNRISDFLFVAARYTNLQLGKSDVPWVSS